MSTLNDVIHKRKLSDAKYEEKRTVVKGMTVGLDRSDSPAVDGRPGFIWIRENGRDGGIFQCFNPSVITAINMPVIISRGILESSIRVVEKIDWDALLISLTSSPEGVALNSPNHHRNHEWQTMYPGLDAVSVYPRSFVPCKIFPGTTILTISVAPGRYMYNGANVQFAGLFNDDFAAYIPTTAGNYVIVLLYIDPATNLVVYLSGAELADPSPIAPTIPDNVLACGFMKLYEGMTAITEIDIIDDARPFFTIGGSADVAALTVLISDLTAALALHIAEGEG